MRLHGTMIRTEEGRRGAGSIGQDPSMSLYIDSLVFLDATPCPNSSPEQHPGLLKPWAGVCTTVGQDRICTTVGQDRGKSNQENVTCMSFVCLPIQPPARVCLLVEALEAVAHAIQLAGQRTGGC